MVRAPRKLLDEQPPAPRRTAGRAVTEREWELVVVLALRGHNVPAIARMTGFHERTLRRFWAEGYPKALWGATPIRRILEEEQAKARALRERIGEGDDPTPFEAEEKARVEAQLGSATLREKEGAKRDALEARVSEGQLVKLARGNVIALAGAAVGLVRPAANLAKKIGEAIELKAKGQALDPGEGIAMLREMARYIKDVVDSGHRAMEMERLLLGDPTGTGRLAHDAASMTDDEAMTTLSNAVKVHAAMQARGWSIVKGGVPLPEAPAGAALDPGKGAAFDTTASRTSTAEPQEPAHHVNGSGPKEPTQ